ncbi:MAG: hypothetical protein ABI702_04015 [Burkholderiales bacterium]
MTGLARGRKALAAVIALAPALLLVDPIRTMIESRMITHMLLQLPLLVASGWMLARAFPARIRGLGHLDAIDAHGLLGISFASCALAFWMIPTALDLALLSEPMRWAKYISLWLAGLLLGRGRQRLNIELDMFFWGTLVWMMATVGLVYQTMPQRLCVNYLIDEQRWTGIGLVAAALLLGLTTLWRLTSLQRACDEPRRPA